MMPHGAAPLISMRKSGHIPSGTVWIRCGDFPDPGWHRFADTMHSPEIVVRPCDPVDRLDLRCIVKLDVTLYFERYDDKAALLFSKLQEYASEIVALSPDFGEDIGFWWLPRYGVIDFEKRSIVTEYEAAKDRRSIADDRKNEPAYRAAQSEELRLLEEHPWLRC